MIPSEELLRAAVQMNLVRAERLQELRGQSRRQRVDVVDLITSEGRFPASMLFRAVAEIRGIPFLDLSAEKVDPVLVTKVPQTIVRRRHVLPVREENGEVLVATTSPDDRGSIEAVERAVGRRVRLAIADQRTLERTISYVFGEAASAVTVADGAADTTADATQLMKELLDQAFLSRASDVHMDPQEDGLKLRLRIDGRLRTMWHVSDEAGAALVSRVKVLAGMDIAEQRAPQDGAFTYQPSNVGDEFDIRVATLPATGGEKVTLRLLGHQTDGLTLDSIGLSKDDRASFREAIRTPYGLILLTGPTGSGKSTTLYSALREINDDDINIMTVEDPVEYSVPGVTQVQVSNTHKVSFASALRSIVRHDPDVIMVGEVRDQETADVSLRAALTGHLVFSTLHTNSACGAIPRLLDLGVERYLIASTLIAVIAQRLARRLCTRCRTTKPAGEIERRLFEDLEQVYESGGCALCNGSGYRGRVGLFECLWVDDAVRTAIERGANEEELSQMAGDAITRMSDDALSKVERGVASFGDVRRIALLSSSGSEA